MRSGLVALPIRNSGKSCNISGSGVLSGSSVIVASPANSVDCDDETSLSSSVNNFFVSFDGFRRKSVSWKAFDLDIDACLLEEVREGSVTSKYPPVFSLSSERYKTLIKFLFLKMFWNLQICDCVVLCHHVALIMNLLDPVNALPIPYRCFSRKY
jgi:hypothetical protein